MTASHIPVSSSSPISVEEGATQSLPFEYEDRSDGRYARRRARHSAEIAAALAWSRSRRAHGKPPN